MLRMGKPTHSDLSREALREKLQSTASKETGCGAVQGTRNGGTARLKHGRLPAVTKNKQLLVQS